MSDAIKPLAELIAAIESLCLENETAKVMLQEYWPPTEKLSWKSALSQNCTARKDRFHGQISKTLPDPLPVVPAQFAAILAALTQAIQSMQEESNLRIEKSR
jgi:hypothetical protein